MRTRTAAALAFLWLTTCLALGQSDPPGSLKITAVPSQGVIAGQKYTLPLAATGGSAPYNWQLLEGNLPPGLKLHPRSGKISGVATTPGQYTFTIGVTDSRVPQLQAQRDFTIQVIAGLIVDWKNAPTVNGNQISGSAVITNQTPNAFDLTVVIVAVNKIGRATALGYQHFTLAAQASSPVIPFASSPGLGTYYVRADAAAHRPGHQHVYRASKQTTDPLKVAQF